jgi:hypothetical protein
VMGRERRATTSRWDEVSDGSGEEDSDDDAQPQRSCGPAPPFFSDVRPITMWVPGPGVWRGQPIDVSDDSNKTQWAEGSTPGLKRKCAEQPTQCHAPPTPAASDDEDDNDHSVDGVPDLPLPVVSVPSKKAF